MKNNFVAKHMNTYNKSSVYEDKRMSQIDELNSVDNQLLEFGMEKSKEDILNEIDMNIADNIDILRVNLLNYTNLNEYDDIRIVQEQLQYCLNFLKEHPAITEEDFNTYVEEYYEDDYYNDDILDCGCCACCGCSCDDDYHFTEYEDVSS